MPCIMESASLEPKFGNKFIAGGEDMWVHVFDFHTGEEIGKLIAYKCQASIFLTVSVLYDVFVVFRVQQGAPWSGALCPFLTRR